MNQALVSGEIDFHLTGGTYSVRRPAPTAISTSAASRPKKGPMAGGKGGIPGSRSPRSSTIRRYRRWRRTSSNMSRIAGDVAHGAFAEGTFNPVTQMGNTDCFELFTAEELDIIQWDSLEEEMARSVEYDIVPDYDKLLDIMTAAKREASGG